MAREDLENAMIKRGFQRESDDTLFAEVIVGTQAVVMNGRQIVNQKKQKIRFRYIGEGAEIKNSGEEIPMYEYDVVVDGSVMQTVCLFKEDDLDFFFNKYN